MDESSYFTLIRSTCTLMVLQNARKNIRDTVQNIRLIAVDNQHTFRCLTISHLYLTSMLETQILNDFSTFTNHGYEKRGKAGIGSLSSFNAKKQTSRITRWNQEAKVDLSAATTAAHRTISSSFLLLILARRSLGIHGIVLRALHHVE